MAGPGRRPASVAPGLAAFPPGRNTPLHAGRRVWQKAGDRGRAAPAPEPRITSLAPMQPFTTLVGVAAPLPMDNVDTDMIIPKQFLKTIERTGLRRGLFHELRTDEAGSPVDFVLDRPAYKDAQILVTGENFGCGSSREHAPWALLDAGIRCVIAPSFADIFYNNCFKNGILPIVLPKEDVAKLMDDAERGANAVVSVDLEAQEIRGPDGGVVRFDIDPYRKRCLLNGLDDIALPLEHGDKIDVFEARGRAEQPWLWGATS